MVRLIETHGYQVFPTVLTGTEVERSTTALDEVFRSESDIAAQRGWVTDAHRVSFVLPAKHPWFLSLVANPALTAIAGSVLGDDCVIAAFNGLSMTPGGTAQRLHRDHPHPTPPHTMYVHLVVALDEFTAENGATRVVPGSHLGLSQVDPDGFDLADKEAEAVPVPVPAGGVVAYDGALLHAGSANTTDRPRRALHLFFGRPWLRPHWDFSASLPHHVSSGLTTEQRRRLGFDTRPARFDTGERTVVDG